MEYELLLPLVDGEMRQVHDQECFLFSINAQA